MQLHHHCIFSYPIVNSTMYYSSQNLGRKRRFKLVFVAAEMAVNSPPLKKKRENFSHHHFDDFFSWLATRYCFGCFDELMVDRYMKAPTPLYTNVPYLLSHLSGHMVAP